MRKSVFAILLATAAMPALAAAQDDEGRGNRDRGTRSEQSENRSGESPKRTERAERSERSSSDQAASVQRTERAARSERSSSDQAASVQRVQRAERIRVPRTQPSQQIVQPSDGSSTQNSGRRNRMTSRPADGGEPATATTRDSTDSVTNWKSRERRAAASQISPTTTNSTNWGDRSRDSQTSTTTTGSTTTRHWDRDRDGRRHWDGDRDGRRRWSSDWRRDNRYDWRRHRSRYSSLFRLGRYYDPYRYGYRRFSTGLTLGSGYYSNSNYWLNDPWQYRLPPAYGPYRWVRYYNDALLVDIYSGQVADVIYGFFW